MTAADVAGRTTPGTIRTFRLVTVVTAACLAALAGGGQAQSFAFPADAPRTPTALDKAMPALARAVMANYREANRGRYLDNLFRLQIAANEDAAASRTLAELQTLRLDPANPQSGAIDTQYAIYARAKVMEAQKDLGFEAAFTRAFDETFARLDDRTSALVARAMSQYSPGISLHVAIEEPLSSALARQKGKSEIALAEALTLVRAYQVAKVYRAIYPLAPYLIAEDDTRRYVVEQDLVRISPTSQVCALVVRPRGATARLTTLLEFSIYADPAVMMSEARRDASNGYAGVEGMTRGKGCSPDKPVAQTYDGADAAALIDWIAARSWSDGRVGMYGASYSGFTAWAAVKHRPAALKALMVGVTEAPGIDSPQEGGVILSFGYYWPFYVLDNKSVDDTAFNDRSRWNKLFNSWYVSGRPYRDLDKIDGTSNPAWDEWVSHPSYDAYWQAMIPYKDEFAAVDIPVLTTTGYYDGGQIGALYYLTQQHHYSPAAEHYLIVGPYDHHSGNRGTIDVLGNEADELAGYVIDPVAHIDLGRLRYQWFDHVFRDGPKPAILKDRINYEVMGANAWRHAASLDAMSAHLVRYHLSDASTGPFLTLDRRPLVGKRSVRLQMNLADRSDVDRTSPATGQIIDKQLDTYGSLSFETAPFDKSVEVSGLFSGHLDFVTNKKDFDFQISLYEMLPDGRNFGLSIYLARASYVSDPSRRQLLTPGRRQRLDFTAGRLTSRRFEPGSRLLVMVSLVKFPAAEINLGSGKPVSEETVADAGPPLTIDWYDDSTVDIPMTG